VGVTAVHGENRVIEARSLLGSTWSYRKKAKILAIVKIIGDHPDPKRVDEIIVLALDLVTGTTEELIFDHKKDEFPWTNLRRM